MVACAGKDSRHPCALPAGHDGPHKRANATPGKAHGDMARTIKLTRDGRVQQPGVKIEASPEEIEKARRLLEYRDQLKAKAQAQTAAVYHDDPAGFILNCFKWEKDNKPTPYQLTNLTKLVKYRRVAVRGPHGLGKTAANAWAILWFALTREAAKEDWKVATTASAWRQLSEFLWPEVRKWARQLDWAKIGREPFTQFELLRLNLRLEYGQAFAVACEDPATIEGAHADQMFYIYDEAKTIPAETFDASEGAFTTPNAFALASSTPGEPAGRFYEIHARKAGFEDWHVVHITREMAEKSGRVPRDWAEQRKLQWGPESAVFINRVEGEFAASEEDGVVPLSWIEQANTRWELLEEAGWPELGQLTHVGADIARSGADRTVLATRFGHVIKELRRLPKQETMATAGAIAALLRTAEHFPAGIVDVIGIGAGVVDRLREQGLNIKAFNAAEKTTMMDKTGELGFLNCRSAAWWNIRECLDPETGIGLALPPDDLLTGDLTAPKWKLTSGGRIQVETKDEVRKRIGRSTDCADAVIHALWTDVRSSVGAPIFNEQPSRWSPMRQSAGW